ncbi:MAG: sigma-70 family RNA polymerase sigma factor, partial [Candidatus Latescibacterota bacterium]
MAGGCRLHATTYNNTQRFARQGGAAVLACLPHSEDLVQDVFVKALQELSNLRDRGKFGPWLGRIALNRAQAWLRQRQSHRTTVTDDPKLLEKVSLERPDLLETAEKYGILWEALDRLRPEYRQILLLFHFKDCPQQDISRFLGISVPTVKWRL